jgi:hypothetical protein
MQIPFVCGKTDNFFYFTLATFKKVFEKKDLLKIPIFGKFEHFYIFRAQKVH